MHDIPLFSATCWTVSNLKTKTVAEELTELMATRKDEFSPAIIYGGILTKKRNRKFDPDNPDIFKQAMLHPEVIRVVLLNRLKDYVFSFAITFGDDFTVVNFEASHGYFVSQERKEKFIAIAKKLIGISNPYFGKIEDMSTSQTLKEKAREKTYGFVSEYVPVAFWGNYFGERHVRKYGRDKLLNSPYGIVEEIGEGILITLTQDPMDFDSPERKRTGKKLKSYLRLGKPSLFHRIIKSRRSEN